MTESTHVPSAPTRPPHALAGTSLLAGADGQGARDRRQRHGGGDLRVRLGLHAARPDRILAAGPQGRGAPAARVALPGLRALGRGPAGLLQRCLRRGARLAPSVGAGPQLPRDLGRDLARGGPAVRGGDARRRLDLERPRAARHGAQGLHRGNLLHVLVQPVLQRRRRGRRRVLHLHRRDQPRAGRTAAAEPARPVGGRARIAQPGPGLRSAPRPRWPSNRARPAVRAVLPAGRPGGAAGGAHRRRRPAPARAGRDRAGRQRAPGPWPRSRPRGSRATCPASIASPRCRPGPGPSRCATHSCCPCPGPILRRPPASWWPASTRGGRWTPSTTTTWRWSRSRWPAPSPTRAPSQEEQQRATRPGRAGSRQDPVLLQREP